jgi:hypothetical protein
VAVQKTSVEYTVIINDLSHITYLNYFVKPACAGVSLC